MSTAVEEIGADGALAATSTGGSTAVEDARADRVLADTVDDGTVGGASVRA
jgi:hypothetical protein